MSARGVGFYAPAGFALDPAAIERAEARFVAWGHEVTVDPTCRSRFTRFAADDAERLAAVRRMAADPRVDIAVTLRGGYGWTRLLPHLDFASIAAADKQWLGYSDFTAFQLAALATAGMVTLAGPSVSELGAAEPSAFAVEHCLPLLERGEHEVACALDGPDRRCEGTLWGGNLALVVHLCGTRYWPAVEGGVLFLEDVGETPYRIERMLYQLQHAGVLARQRAILLGHFTEYTLSPNDGGYTLQSAIAQLRRICAAPVFTGLPFGHVKDKLTLPVGGHCALDVRDGQGRLALRVRPT